MAARSLFLTLTRYYFPTVISSFFVIFNNPFYAQILAKLIWVFCICRNARRDKKIPFRSISSSIEAVKQEPIRGTHEVSMDEFTEEEKDDLKSRIFRLSLPKRSVTNVLQKWVSEGHIITLSDLRSISRDLRRSRRYKHALEVCKVSPFLDLIF